MAPLKLAVFVFVCLSTCSWRVNGELFTALVDLKKMLHTGFLSYLDEYLDAEEDRLEKIERSVVKYKKMKENIPDGEDGERYLSNPVNSFLLLKALTRDWNDLRDQILLDKPAQKFIKTYHEVSSYLPNEEDLQGAVDALLRLQDMYQLEPANIARGQIEGSTNSNTLTANDCFELGKQAYTKGDHYHTVQWMGEALSQYENEMNKTVAKSDILEYLAFSNYMEGNVRKALRQTNELLELVPHHDKAPGNKAHFESVLKEDSSGRRRGEEAVVGEGLPGVETRGVRTPYVNSFSNERQRYEHLCRQAVPLVAKRSKRLKCSYFTNGNAFLLLQPAKQEVVFDSPTIYRYHDILSHHDITVIKSLATPRLNRATIHDPATGKLQAASYRISKSAWLKREEHKVISSIWDRVEAITGLDMSSSEDLQVVNYGIGGHYDPHYDFARKEETNAFDEEEGNRIATTLFYLSDVDAGGATVFPDAGARVMPIKGSCVFWWNLFKSGEGDYSTRHAACPVLTGSKWVSNFWIHERGQEFRRPCGLTEKD